MVEVCESFSGTEFKDYDALLVFISSHGDEGNLIYGTDGKSITVNEVVGKFKGKISLANKPKLFFMQNCRGRNADRGSGTVQADNPPIIPARIPYEADMLVAYSTVDGYESYIDETQGSWFITCLMKVLNERDHNMNLTDLLSIVNKRVASLHYRGRKQMSCFESTLRMSVYFGERERRMSASDPQGRRMNRTSTFNQRQREIHRTNRPNEQVRRMSTTTASDQQERRLLHLSHYKI